MERYCFKCRAKREIKDPQQATMKNGKPATKGVCRSADNRLPHWEGMGC